MPSMYKRLPPPTVMTANYQLPDLNVVDLGAYRVLEVYIKILKPGPSNATVFLSHNASLDPDNWKALSGASLAQNGTDLFVTVPDFLRYVRVEGNLNGDGSCIALVDVVAKE